MNDSHFERKVGLFVAFGLLLSALLILNFSKGFTLFKKTNTIHITMSTVAGLKPAADVMMSGVPIGKVVATPLNDDGSSVDVKVEILARLKIHTNATFRIDALGFIGDEYIEITPAEGSLEEESKVPFLTNGQTIMGEKPLNMQEAVRSVSGFVEQGQKTMRDIDKAVTNITDIVLAPGNLSNFVATITEIESVTTNLVNMAAVARGLLDSNAPTVRSALANFADASQRLTNMAVQLEITISSVSANTNDVADTVKHIKAASANLQQITDNLMAGQGLAGRLLKDEKMNSDYDNMKTNLATALTTIGGMADEFRRFGQNLNQNSLWHILTHKPAPTNAPAH
jgi:phospholipid/cholesterol/gamma-HCH transport system substrate-binding protein